MPEKKFSQTSTDPTERRWAVRQSVQQQHQRVGDNPREFASGDIPLPSSRPKRTAKRKRARAGGKSR